MNNIISISDLKKEYTQGHTKIEVLKGIDLQVSGSKSICITGRSGTGKSTLIHLIAGLDFATSGQIKVLGQDTRLLNDSAISEIRLNHIGIVFQFHHLLPEFTVKENVMLPLLAKKMNKKSAESRAEWLLNEVSLSDRMDSKPPYLSGGEKQKVAVARALANNPDIILGDEPTGNLDKENTTKIFDLLLKLCYTYKKVCIIVTHTQDFLKNFDEKYVLSDGKLEKY